MVRAQHRRGVTLEEIWNVMQIAGIIEINGAKIRPGSAAEQRRSGGVPAETPLPLVGAFIHELLGNATGRVDDRDSSTSRLVLVQRIAETLDAEAERELPELELAGKLAQAVEHVVGKVIEVLIGNAIFERAADSSPTVPRQFHRIVAGAAVMLLSR